MERRIVGLLQEKLYNPDAIACLVQKINERLQRRQPELSAESERLLEEQATLTKRLLSLRRFIEQGDTSARVREWLAETEQPDDRINQRVAEIQCQVQAAPVLVHPERVRAYLGDILGSLAGKSSEPPPGPPSGYRREVILRARALKTLSGS